MFFRQLVQKVIIKSLNDKTNKDLHQSIIPVLVFCVCFIKSSCFEAEHRHSYVLKQNSFKSEKNLCLLLLYAVTSDRLTMMLAHPNSHRHTGGCAAAQVYKTQWKVRVELSAGSQGGWMLVRACHAVRVRRRCGETDWTAVGGGTGCDDSSSTCCLSLALARSAIPLPPGDEATFLTSLTRRRSDAKYPI